MAKHLHNILVERIVESAIERAAAIYMRGKLLDIGCSSKPYRNLLAKFVTQHIGVDHIDSRHKSASVDRLGSAYKIPAEDREFDSVLCTAVLEHLEDPSAALKECHRVLKPGGFAIYTVPFIWHLHEEPRDFYRYSKYGLRYLFEKAGFAIVELSALSGFWVTFGQLLTYNLYRLNKGVVARLRLLAPMGLGIQGAAWMLDQIDRTEQWTWMYLVVAQRPEELAVAAAD